MNGTTKGKLWIVSTPIGNLGDITLRAIEVMKSVDLLLAEDTRVTRKLLTHFEIKVPICSYHGFNERKKLNSIIEMLRDGKSIALVSDAGMPGISDPGYRVVRLAVEHGIQVVPVPGPSALTAALSASGLPGVPFFFAGFLPPRQKALEKTLAKLADIEATLVFYSPARRIRSVLDTALRILGNRRAAICRELTKLHEEFIRGSLSHLEEILRERETLKGELVLIVEGKTGEEKISSPELSRRLELFLEELGDPSSMGAKTLTALAAERLAQPRNRLYPLVCAYLNRLK